MIQWCSSLFALITVFLLMVATASAAGVQCRAIFRVESEKGPVPISDQAKAIARDLVLRQAIPTRISSQGIEVEIELDDKLYRQVEVEAKIPGSSGQIIVAEGAYFAAWPCADVSEVILQVVAADDSAELVDEMWQSQDALNPKSVEEASINFAKALETAKNRHTKWPNSKHQYDLIASYLALRNFISYMNLSAPVVAGTSSLKEIACWHEKLCRRVEGLENIKKEALYKEYEKQALARLYEVKWNEIEKISKTDLRMAFHSIRRFNRSITQEKHSDYILNRIRMPASELLLSANSYAGKIEFAELQDTEMQQLYGKQIEDSRAFVRDARPGNQAAERIKKDIKFLEQRLEASRSLK